ncbi:hypothetical protein JW911_04440 [Candidatus Peregrinibacteria bacterium]|nr:hypothetical protein [Candidatus Peregrinibacteria bacterium]
MKTLITILFIISHLFGIPDYCRTNIGDLTFFQPEGYIVTNTWAKNGVLTISDPAGNGMDIGIEKGSFDDIDKKILSIRSDWSNSIINEEKLHKGGHLFRIRNVDKIAPIDTIILIPKNNFIIEAFLMKVGDPQTHGAFEEEAQKILRSIEQGETTDEMRAESCLNGLLLSY